jgi:hypothetical protein
VQSACETGVDPLEPDDDPVSDDDEQPTITSATTETERSELRIAAG